MDCQLVLSFQMFVLPTKHYINVSLTWLHPQSNQENSANSNARTFWSLPNNQFQDFQIPAIRVVSPVLEGACWRLNESISRTSPQPHVKPKPWSSHNNGLFCRFGITTAPTQTFEGTAQNRINLNKSTQLGMHMWERENNNNKKLKFRPHVSTEIFTLYFTSMWDTKDTYQYTLEPAASHSSFFPLCNLTKINEEH